VYNSFCDFRKVATSSFAIRRLIRASHTSASFSAACWVMLGLVVVEDDAMIDARVNDS